MDRARMVDRVAEIFDKSRFGGFILYTLVPVPLQLQLEVPYCTHPSEILLASSAITKYTAVVMQVLEYLQVLARRIRMLPC